mmetsp:Transcript_81845/g.218878  ORF Transcript_81845/g.218878 Transcript_81845/m.218878 type:complete len:314 (-) Transcript_81845:742-1683(-)
MLSERPINHTHSQHAGPQAVRRHLRRVDHTTCAETLPLMTRTCGSVGVTGACRAQPQNGHRPSVGLRKTGNHSLVQLRLLGRSDCVLITRVSSVLAGLLQLGIGGLICLREQTHTHIRGLPESRNFEHSTSQPWTILHRLHQIPHSLKILRPDLLVVASLRGLAGHLLQLLEGRLQVLQLVFLSHQLILCMSHRINALGSLSVQRGHLSRTLLLHSLLASHVVASISSLFHKILQNQVALCPLLLQSSPLLLALLRRKRHHVIILAVAFLCAHALMSRNRRRRSGSGRVLLELQSRHRPLPCSGHTSLQSTRR